MDKVASVIAHIEKNERELDRVSIERVIGSWWIQLGKGNITSRPAVHESLVDAYAIALAHFEEAMVNSMAHVDNYNDGTI